MKLYLNTDQGKMMRRAAREEQVAALREGRKLRAVTIPNKKAKANRLACRKGQW